MAYFRESLMALHTVHPGAKTNDVIPVFSGNRMFTIIVNTGEYPYTALT
jgi:hypothetical protein